MNPDPAPSDPAPSDPAPSDPAPPTTSPLPPVTPANRSPPPLTEEDGGGAPGSDGSASPPLSPSPSLGPSPGPSPSQVSVSVPCAALECGGAGPDLECAICFNEFNNVFRCPKMLSCRHTFCLECLARINVAAAEAGAVTCPLCRRPTALPGPGPPKLPTDAGVLSYLPAAMQRVYSIRFLRHKGKLEVKRSTDGPWGQRASRSAAQTLSVGLPAPPPPPGGRGHGVGGALFRLTGRPACRALLLSLVVMMMVLLTGIIIFLITYEKRQD